jgi:hypothetical protein
MTIGELRSFRDALDRLETGDLDGAHKIVQSLEGIPAADAVHAIIHRRDGDFSNSCYWWRRVGGALPPALRELYGEPVEFVEHCRQTIPGSPESAEIRAIEKQEIEVLRSLLPDTQV